MMKTRFGIVGTSGHASRAAAPVLKRNAEVSLLGAAGSARERRQVAQCAAAAKHVLVEKPLATSFVDAQAAVRAAEAAGVILRVGCQHRAPCSTTSC